MNTYLRGASLFLAAASLSACATVTRGTTQSFTVESSPPAEVKTSTGFSCPSTPCTLKLPRKEGFTVTVTKAGYKTHTSEVVSKMSGGGGAALAGNVLAGGIIGMGVDASSGALNDLTPNPLKVVLEPEVATAPAAEAAAAPAAASGTP